MIGLPETISASSWLDGVDFLIQRECDGIIVFSNELEDQDLIALHRKQPKIAVLNRMIPELSEQCFSVDHYQGGRIAAQVLVSQGHRRLAVISGLHSASACRSACCRAIAAASSTP